VAGDVPAGSEAGVGSSAASRSPVRVGPREASFYYYSTQFDSRGKPKRVGYNRGRWPETTLERAAEA
jgi:hypothetical protein